MTRFDRDGYFVTDGWQNHNRALFGKFNPRPFNWDNYRFKAVAGETPRALYDDEGYDGGRLAFRLDSAPLDERPGRTMRYRKNEVVYTWADLPLTISVTPLYRDKGMLARVERGAGLAARFGWASGYRFETRGSGPTSHPPETFAISEDKKAGNRFAFTDGGFDLSYNAPRGPVRGRASSSAFALADGVAECVIDADEWYLAVSDRAIAPSRALYEDVRAHWDRVADQMKMTSPSELLDLATETASNLLEALWDEPMYAHGAWSWELPFTGWRSVYGPICRGDHARARTEFDHVVSRQIAAGEREGWLPDFPTDLGIDYDMGTVLANEILYEYRWNGDLAYAEAFFPALSRFVACQKRLFDRGGLYDARIDVWASDSVYYNGGGTLIGSAYNYGLNRGLADMARDLGKESAPFDAEADRIARAVRETLWMPERGYFAEYERNGVLYPSMSMYCLLHGLECGLFTAEEAELCIQYLERDMEHVPCGVEGGEMLYPTNWVPYTWSVREIDYADEYHYALSLFRCGHWERALKLLEGAALDETANPVVPGSFTCEYALRNAEFSDAASMYTRAVVEGLWGVEPNLPRGVVRVSPRLPREWESASLTTPDITVTYARDGETCRVTCENRLGGELRVYGPSGEIEPENGAYAWTFAYPTLPGVRLPDRIAPPAKAAVPAGVFEIVPLPYNAKGEDLYRRTYESPRPDCWTLETPPHLYPSDWVIPENTKPVDGANFDVLRARGANIVERNVVFRPSFGDLDAVSVSKWDNDPDRATVPLSGRARAACFLITGYTSHMLVEAENARVTVRYADGGEARLSLIPPYNFQPMCFFEPEGAVYRNSSVLTRVTDIPKQVKRPMDAFAYRFSTVEDVTLGKDTHGQFLCLPLDAGRALSEVVFEAKCDDAVLSALAMTIIR